MNIRRNVDRSKLEFIGPFKFQFLLFPLYQLGFFNGFLIGFSEANCPFEDNYDIFPEHSSFGLPYVYDVDPCAKLLNNL